jgi:2-oxo-4-hydroxy-4-carboxy-5-ureidoimidazoline decarboxylase
MNSQRELPCPDGGGSPVGVTVEEASGLGREEFVARFGGVYENSPWIAEAAWRERPFHSLSELHGAMESAVNVASEERKMELIRAHPDLAGKAVVAGELTPESEREQASAGLDRLSPEEYEAFTETNYLYREKFGMPLIFCVREYSKESILKGAEERLGNSREEEVETALVEISKIARLRLGDLVEEGGKR